MDRALDTPKAVSTACRGEKGSVPRVRCPHYSLTLANGMGFSHTTWTTPPTPERSRMGLPRATLTYGKGTRHPEGGKRDLQGEDGSVPRVRGPHYSLTLANGMGFSHTTWTTPPIHERSRMGLPRATLTYGKGTWHPEGGKRDLQGGGGFGSTGPRPSLLTKTS